MAVAPGQGVGRQTTARPLVQQRRQSHLRLLAPPQRGQALDAAGRADAQARVLGRHGFVLGQRRRRVATQHATTAGALARQQSRLKPEHVQVSLNNGSSGIFRRFVRGRRGHGPPHTWNVQFKPRAGAQSAGRLNSKQLPPPSRGKHRTCPPWRVAICRTKASPRPTPPSRSA